MGLKNLAIGQNAKDVADRLSGIPCGGKTTSCPDQLAKAIRESL
ncbi:MAG: TSCPD domain-containing protein [Peptostreptococcaceae bacterium]